MIGTERPKYIELNELNEASIGFSLSILDDLEQFIPSIRRLYFLASSFEPVVRGNHAHLNQHQILFLIEGKATLNLESVVGEKFSFKFDGRGILIPPKYWIELEMDSHSKVLCLASQAYCKLLSINKKEAFSKLS